MLWGSNISRKGSQALCHQALRTQQASNCIVTASAKEVKKARKLIFKPNLEHLKRKSAAAAASRCKCADDDRQITQIEQIADPQIARS